MDWSCHFDDIQLFLWSSDPRMRLFLEAVQNVNTSFQANCVDGAVCVSIEWLDDFKDAGTCVSFQWLRCRVLCAALGKSQCKADKPFHFCRELGEIIFRRTTQ